MAKKVLYQDEALCESKLCPNKEKCLRWTFRPIIMKMRQNYISPPFEEDGTCDMFIDNI